MLFTIGLVLSLVFLEWPWPLAVIIPLGLIEMGEVMLWLRWRNRRATMGPEAIVGAPGVAVTDLVPDGQVKVKGQLWKARAEGAVAAGEAVTVTAVEGIRLDVTRQ